MKCSKGDGSGDDPAGDPQITGAHSAIEQTRQIRRKKRGGGWGRRNDGRNIKKKMGCPLALCRAGPIPVGPSNKQTMNARAGLPWKTVGNPMRRWLTNHRDTFGFKCGSSSNSPWRTSPFNDRLSWKG